MTKRWIPSAWLDEMVEGLSENPNAFLRRTEAGVLQLHPIEGEEVDAEADWRIRTLQPDEIVEFSWTENYGEGTVTVTPDGAWTCDREFPASATHFWLPYDPDTMQPTLAALVTGAGGWDEAAALEPGEHVVGAYAWSEGPIRFVVRIRDLGEAEFVEVGTA